MPTYSEPTDFLIGDLKVPAFINATKVCQDAADEIDSHIGFLYKTPVDMTDTGPTSRPARLLLKRISTHLSSGRLIMAMDQAGQDEQLHAYGIYLVDQALQSLAQIANGQIVLDGAETPDADAAMVTAPLISNLDSESNVEAFYNRVATPRRTRF